MPAPLLDAKVAKTKAEAAAATQRAAAEAAFEEALQAKLKAEAAAVTQRAASKEAKLKAEQAAAFRKEIAWWSIAAVGVGVAAGIAAALALDFRRHESSAYIKRGIRRMLLSVAPPEAHALRPVTTLIKVPQVPLIKRLASKPSERLRRRLRFAAKGPCLACFTP
jgi:hypothetical protein